MKTTIGITCVGSGIGQSIIDALRLCGYNFRIIGFDLNPLSYGGVYCDVFYHSVAIRDLADCVNNAAKQIGLEQVPIRIEPGKDERKFGMDITLFCRDFNWEPDVSLGEGIQELVQAAEERNLFIQN